MCRIETSAWHTQLCSFWLTSCTFEVCPTKIKEMSDILFHLTLKGSGGGKNNQIYWSEYCRLKAADFSVAQRGIVEGWKVTVSVESFSSFHLPHLFMCESRGRKTNLWLLFHPCTWFPAEDACCRRTGALFIFIHIYLLKWAALCLYKGELSQYHKCVHSSSTVLKHCWKNAAFLFKTEHINIVMKALAESAMYCINRWAIDMHSTI